MPLHLSAEAGDSHHFLVNIDAGWPPKVSWVCLPTLPIAFFLHWVPDHVKDAVIMQPSWWTQEAALRLLTIGPSTLCSLFRLGPIEAIPSLLPETSTVERWLPCSPLVFLSSTWITSTWVNLLHISQIQNKMELKGWSLLGIKYQFLGAHRTRSLLDHRTPDSQYTPWIHWGSLWRQTPPRFCTRLPCHLWWIPRGSCARGCSFFLSVDSLAFGKERTCSTSWSSEFSSCWISPGCRSSIWRSHWQWRPWIVALRPNLGQIHSQTLPSNGCRTPSR